MRRRMVWLVAVIAALSMHVTPLADARQLESSSPARCGPGDTPENGIQGDVLAQDKASGRAALGYNCGLALVGAFPEGNAVQVYDHCAYVRTGAGISSAGPIKVLDISDPARPKQVAVLPSFAPAHGSTSETMRLVAAPDRVVLVSGSGVYDVEDCDRPVVKGQIPWPGLLPWPAGLSHDIRVSPDGKTVWAGVGVTEADISDLDHPKRWKVTNHTCAVAAQYQAVHGLLAAAGVSQCDIVPDTFPQIGHGPGINDDGSRVYEGNQLLVSAFHPEDGAVRILDTTTDHTPRIVSTIPGPGHSIDWFRTANGREYLLHTNEIVAAPQSTCIPQQARPWSLGWAHDAYITDITDETRPVRAAEVQLEINSADNCLSKLASGQNTAGRLPLGRRPEQRDVRHDLLRRCRAAPLRHPRPEQPDRGRLLQRRDDGPRGRVALRPGARPRGGRRPIGDAGARARAPGDRAARPAGAHRPGLPALPEGSGRPAGVHGGGATGIPARGAVRWPGVGPELPASTPELTCGHRPRRRFPTPGRGYGAAVLTHHRYGAAHAGVAPGALQGPRVAAGEAPAPRRGRRAGRGAGRPTRTSIADAEALAS